MPLDVAFAPTNKCVYVTNNADPGNVWVISTTSNAVVATIPAGAYALGIAVNSQITTATSPLFESDPNSGPNSKEVQISNSSGLQLQVQSGGVNSVVSPYNVLTVPTNSGNAVVVSFTSTNVQAVGSMTLYWCTPRDLTPLNDGPLSSQGVAGALG